MTRCPSCGEDSGKTYRCTECGKDLVDVDEPTEEPWRVTDD